ncbi:MAG TPA: nuclear transport factor 2 family protein [Caulobacteraceae bacterium]|jgi:ketosteroid isomerase-like protein
MTKPQFAGAAVAVLMAVSLGACNAKPAVDTAKIADAVKADATQRIADVNAHDAAKVASHDAADAIAMFHGRANATGPAAIAASFNQSMAISPDLHVTLSDPVVDVAASGDLAVIHSTTVATFTDPKTKQPVTTTSNSVAGYKPQADGTWKIEWSVVSDVAPAPAAKG